LPEAPLEKLKNVSPGPLAGFKGAYTSGKERGQERRDERKGVEGRAGDCLPLSKILNTPLASSSTL